MTIAICVLYDFMLFYLQCYTMVNELCQILLPDEILIESNEARKFETIKLACFELNVVTDKYNHLI